MSADLSLAASTLDRPAIRTRWLILTLLSVLGALAYLPALAVMGVPIDLKSVLTFTLIAAAVCGAAAWLGLRWADRAGLPMPLLLAFEGRAAGAALDGRGALFAVGGGVVLAVVSVGSLRVLDLENMAGPLAVRLASTLFAAITIEVVIHLAIMSALVAWTRSRWIGIVGATVIFVLFHAAGSLTMPAEILLTVVVLNAASGVFFGWLYARFGFEYLVLAHAVAHALAVGIR